ncbi:MAG: MlaD family protein [Planctomycetota bacterium]
MTDDTSHNPGQAGDGPGLPTAERVSKRRLPLGWLLPILGLALVGYFGYWAYAENLPNATLEVSDASGIKAFQTPVRCRGVEVGSVTSVRLNAEGGGAVIRMRLNESAIPLATADSDWWVVRPELGLTDVSGIEALLAGPAIEFRPGDSAPATKFTALDGPPADAGLGDGLRLLLSAGDRGAVEPGTPLRHRGVPIGRVVNLRLLEDGRAVVFTVEVDRPFAHLVRDNSVFWHSETFDATVSRLALGLEGYNFEVPRLNRALDISIDVATPNSPGQAPEPGRVYELRDDPPQGVSDWRPALSHASSTRPTPSDADADRDPSSEQPDSTPPQGPVEGLLQLINPFD